MTVSELIEKLKEYSPDLPVYVNCGYGVNDPVSDIGHAQFMRVLEYPTDAYVMDVDAVVLEVLKD